MLYRLPCVMNAYLKLAHSDTTYVTGFSCSPLIASLKDIVWIMAACATYGTCSAPFT